MNLESMRKALVPVGVALVVALLGKLGITPNLDTNQLITMLVTSVLVWLIPNKQ